MFILQLSKQTRGLLCSIVVCALSLVFFPCNSRGTTISVPNDFSTIQEAIDSAVDEDEIIVQQGTYQENIKFKGKNIILRSTDPDNASVVENTVIDGNNADSVITFSGNESEECILTGFTITNGENIWGGGILGMNTHARITSNIISDNWAIAGGGIYRCRGRLESNTIQSNYADEQGGGISESHGIIDSNIIADNLTGGTWGRIVQLYQHNHA